MVSEKKVLSLIKEISNAHEIMEDDSVNVNASLLMKDHEITIRVDELEIIKHK